MMIIMKKGEAKKMRFGMKYGKRVLLILCLLLVSTLFLLRTHSFAGTEVFITTDELSTLLGKPDVVIIDGRFPESYERMHIPGAVNMVYEVVEGLRDNNYYNEMRESGLPIVPEKAEELLGRLGIGNNSKVIVYDNPPDRSAGFLWAALTIMGVKDVRILEGGIKKWRKEMREKGEERRPLTDEVPQPKPAAFKLNSRNELIANVDYILKNMDNLQFLDTRTAQEYAGLGHIPGTVNREWKKFANGKEGIESPEEIVKVMEEAGFTKDKEIVVYCNTGSRAGLPFLALKMAGYKARLYWGSMDEWKQDPNLPMMKK